MLRSQLDDRGLRRPFVECELGASANYEFVLSPRMPEDLALSLSNHLSSSDLQCVSSRSEDELRR